MGESLGAGVWRFVVDVPHNRPRTVNVYGVDTGDGFVLVDVGWDEASWRSLVDGLRLAGARLSDVAGVVLTHGHPDHAGLAARIQNEVGCWVKAHPAEGRWMGDAAVRRRADNRARWPDLLGLPEPAVESMRERAERARAMAAPAVLDPLDDGGIVGGRLRAIRTAGHSPGHLCLVDRSGDVFSGDHVLPDLVSPLYLGVDSPNPLRDFFDGIERLEAPPPGRLLPGHGDPVTEPAARFAAVRAHYANRLRLLLAEIDPRDPSAVSPWVLAQRLPHRQQWTSMSSLTRTNAAIEVLALLRFAESAGLVAPLRPER